MMSHGSLNRFPVPLSKDGSIHVTDEFYNTLISSLGAAFFLCGTAYLAWASLQTLPFAHTLGFFVYGFSMTLLFLSSALHHGIDGSERTNHILRQLDYCAIYVAIAGSMTPFCVMLLSDAFGRNVLGGVWTLAILGVILKAAFPGLPKPLSILLYIGLSLSGLAVLPAFYERAPEGVAVLLFGGLFLLVGAVIYYFEKPNPVPGRFGFHEIWHALVVTGTGAHFFAVAFYLLPLG